MAQQQEKKKRLSFLGKIFRSSKKSSKDTSTTADDSFRRQCALYHSFHSTNALQDNNISSDEAGNFTTLENSAFMDMHKDAGIIFLNKNSITNSIVLREEDRHVQFVPTPMNKYYNVDVKSAPAKFVKKDENKENVGLNKSLKPTRPILRFGKSRENLPQKEDYKSNQNLVDSGKLKFNVTYIDGPQVKQTPTIPRTSTKMVLLDRKNGSMPFLNISEITKYGSLPRSTKASDERYRSGNEVQVQGDSYDIKAKLFFPPVENRNLGFNRPLTEAGIQSKYLRKTDKTGFNKSISDIPRHVEQRRCLQQGVCNDANRYNMGETHMVVQTRSQDCQPLKIVKDHLQIHKFGNMNCFNQVNCQLPNKAINEIGLPSNVQNCQQRDSNKLQGTSDSPHYIPLAEAYSSSRHVKQIQSENLKTQTGYYLKNSDFVRPNTRKQLPIPLNNGPRNSLNTTNLKLTNPPHNPAMQGTMTIEEYSHFVSQARNQVIRSSMISHRRKFVNKICKYKSKECEDGFSSMADDECSFNCSCSSCLAKFSRDYKKNMNRNSLHLNADDKFFFITTEEHGVHERASLPPVPEIPHTTENDRNMSVNGKVQSAETTWYECNDSLCKTPKTSENITEGTTAILTPRDFQEDRLVESIYENITQIINSATKRNFNKQDIQTMFSTPLSRSKVAKEVAEVTSNKKVSRALFASADNLTSTQTKPMPSTTKSPVAFSDSVILLQEIFQKLSQECRELLQPNASSATPINQQSSSNPSQMSVSSSGSKYVNDLVKNLRSKEISEGDFASIIGGIAQNIFLEAKLKQKVLRISHSTSLPDLTKEELQPKIQSASSVENVPKCTESQIKESPEDKGDLTTISSTASDNLNDRSQPDGWSKSPTTTTENSSGDSIAEHSNSSKDDSRTSDSDAQILEMAIRLGMGLSPISKEEKTTYFSASPAKATKYKSKDVLSGKGKLKLKIYHYSGLVTVNVMRAAKLNRINGKDLNPYIKISMVPDCSKRVHWRTSVQKGYKNPIFNQKFSFEILAEDITKRLVFSVWHRDFTKERSELVGCMSFSVRHVMDDSHKIDGWYRLLREGFGTQKHFAAHTQSNSCSLKQVKQGF